MADSSISYCSFRDSYNLGLWDERVNPHWSVMAKQSWQPHCRDMQYNFCFRNCDKIYINTTCSLVFPVLSPITTWSSRSWATFGSSTLRDSFTNCVTSTCQSVPSRKVCWPSTSSSMAPLLSLMSATKWVRMRRVVLWYWATQAVSVLPSTGSTPSLSSVTLSYLMKNEKRKTLINCWQVDQCQTVFEVKSAESSLWTLCHH